MKILIVGSGGREHAIAASVAKSPKAEKIYCAPGNAGIAQLAECVPIGAMEFDRLTEFAKENEIDLVIDTPSQGVEHAKDGFLIRRNAIETGVNVLTALDTAQALITSLENNNINKLSLFDIATVATR